MTTLILATRNPHKADEIQAILGSSFRCLTLSEFPNAPEVLEDAHTFSGNATKKAVALAKWLSTSRPALLQTSAQPALVLADDSGLEVDALGGAPGIHSARFAALDAGKPANSPTTGNNAKLLRLLSAIPGEKRTARFHCVLALTPVIQPSLRGNSPVCDADEFELQTQLFDGTCEGRIGFEPRGSGGFGYDPLFFPSGYDLTFGELGEDIKNRLSHRAKALVKLRRSLQLEAT